MNYIIFDLEWNRFTRAVKVRCADEIIQIGAVKYNENMEFLGSFKRYIKPVLYKKMEPTVEKLTGISMSLLKREGVSFPEALNDFCEFVGQDAVLMSWGSQDADILKKNCSYFCSGKSLSFLCKFVDVQRYVTHTLSKGGNNQIGVKNAADKLLIPYEESKLHDALVDAEISGKVFAKIFDLEKLEKYIVDASKKTISFKDVPITDLSSKLIDKTVFKVRCPECGRPIRKRISWTLSGSKFVSCQVCRRCNKRYFCSVEILKSYGNVIKYKKKIKHIDDTAKKKELARQKVEVDKTVLS